MLAYKFRSSSQIAFALDIIFNNRLRCSDWSELNDPMEGIFAYNYSSTAQLDLSELTGNIVREQQKIRICSLSETFDSHLLWAHYASGFDGLAIEVELPDNTDVIRRVRYGGVFAVVHPEDKKGAEKVAESVLTSKYEGWKYEQEIRIFNRGEWYTLASPVKRIITGHRMNPALLKALRIICSHHSIPICRTGIGDEGIDADLIPSLEGF